DSAIAAACGQLASNRFVMTGRGGVSVNPELPLPSSSLWHDIRPIALSEPGANSAATISQPDAVFSPPAIVEAQAAAIDAQGNVQLFVEQPQSVNHQASLCLGDS
ncbi:MAG: hypothetical protein F6J97_11545, partial [Leptolyngbya sp. SIO4C1]|nr:hypothetical protein [Leptolyngbya sp. SIO4C1]